MNDTSQPAVPRISPVILCGGSGTRLWPLSRTDRPKQMLPLTESLSLLQSTVARVSDQALFEPAMVVTSAAQAAAVIDQMQALGTPPGLLIVESAARNTAPAIALAAVAAPEDSLLLVMPSDHVIADVPALLVAVRSAAATARAGWLVTFGIVPERPETGFGYIRRGEALAEGVHCADAFIEKPDAATAAAYLADGRYLWNAGIFLFARETFLNALAEHAPEVDSAVRRAVAGGVQGRSRLAPRAQCFEKSPSISIDHAVMERAARVAVVPVRMGWSDVGSWQALADLLPTDCDGNSGTGATLAVGAEGCLLWSDGPLIAAVGVSNMAVVATSDAVLVVPLNDSQRVKEVVEILKARGDGRI